MLSVPLPGAPPLGDELPPLLPSRDDEAVPDEQPALVVNRRARTQDAGTETAELANLRFMYTNCPNVGIFVTRKS